MQARPGAGSSRRNPVVRRFFSRCLKRQRDAGGWGCAANSPWKAARINSRTASGCSSTCWLVKRESAPPSRSEGGWRGRNRSTSLPIRKKVPISAAC